MCSESAGSAVVPQWAAQQRGSFYWSFCVFGVLDQQWFLTGLVSREVHVTGVLDDTLFWELGKGKSGM